MSGRHSGHEAWYDNFKSDEGGNGDGERLSFIASWFQVIKFRATPYQAVGKSCGVTCKKRCDSREGAYMTHDPAMTLSFWRRCEVTCPGNGSAHIVVI